MISLKAEGHENLSNGSTIEAMVAEFEKAINLVAVKSEGYGDAWRVQGWMGNLARIMSKVARLRTMLWRTEDAGQSGDEAVEDTALDLVNLSVFFLLNRRHQNRWGSK